MRVSPASEQCDSRRGKKTLQKPNPAAEIKGDNPSENAMTLQGGCYCGQLRYLAEGEPMMKAQCHCRECQYISGGSPNMFVRS
jgi:hypothetical protein